METSENINANAVELKRVNKIFSENTGLKNISFQVERGAFHLLIGSNGAGKTTIIRTILRIYKNYDGVIKINGKDTTNKDAYKHVNYISESPIFPREFNAKNYLLWAGRMSGRSDNEIKSDIDRISKRLNVNHLMNKKPNKFSSGEKQKIMLIKILIEKSDILIMDEPTANLDPSARIIFFNEIEKIHKEGKTIFISTHNLSEVENRANRLTIIKNGEIAYDGIKESGKTLIDMFKLYAHENEENIEMNND